MKKIKLVSGLIWAFLCLILVLALFPEMNALSGSFARLPFMKINPNYTGGEVVNHIELKNYSINVRKPVFDGLIGERRKGFVQIDWHGSIPDVLDDTIDYDQDKRPDFRIHLSKAKTVTEIETFNSKAGRVITSTPASFGWVVRVEVKK